ncbi:hypothetical protein [Pedobacter frigiditerrae]|uniref:hypothetical protein n=1 Tax=Pedobacter frigiditerrae TaxID=2530452 RepID=UPI00292ED031|nr:hypothetical protein [Pedobacter frigiditerrae]
MEQVIIDFFKNLEAKQTELYSEAGLQHELAIYLRINHPEFTVKLEYPTTWIYPNSKLIKKEMDIYIQRGEDKYLIELKMLKSNSGTPNQLYKTIEDVKFGEQLVELGFTNSYCILISNNPSVWQAKTAKGMIYKMFNGDRINISSIADLTELQSFLQSNNCIQLSKTYSAGWNKLIDYNNVNWQYYILSINENYALVCE